MSNSWYFKVKKMDNIDLATNYHDLCNYSKPDAVEMRKDCEREILNRFTEMYSDIYAQWVEEGETDCIELMPEYTELLKHIELMNKEKIALVLKYVHDLLGIKEDCE